jgi:hypothetical protein
MSSGTRGARLLPRITQLASALTWPTDKRRRRRRSPSPGDRRLRRLDAAAHSKQREGPGALHHLVQLHLLAGGVGMSHVAWSVKQRRDASDTGVEPKVAAGRSGCDGWRRSGDAADRRLGLAGERVQRQESLEGARPFLTHTAVPGPARDSDLEGQGAGIRYDHPPTPPCGSSGVGDVPARPA